MFRFNSLDEALECLPPILSAQDKLENTDQTTDIQPNENNPVFAAALTYLQNGISVLPIKTDGTKAPALSSWKQLQQNRMTVKEARTHFQAFVGIAVIGGAISGNLEIADFDEEGLFDKFLSLLPVFELAHLLGKLVFTRTPDGGNHIYYQCEGRIGGNKQLAQASNRKVRIETRGEGGYAIVPPSPVSCHPKGLPYEFIQGDFSSLPVLTQEERERLHACAAVFNQLEDAAHQTEESLCCARSNLSSLRPGDDFSQRATWADVLPVAGWMPQKSWGEVQQWTRPGKDKGVSATTNIHGTDLFYVFSSNAHPFEQNKSYSKFAAYTLLKHAGDYKAAAKALASQGYGDKISMEGQTRRAISTESNTEKPVFRLSDVGNAQRLVFAHGDMMRYVPVRGKWYIWNGSQWVVDDTGEVQRLAKKVAVSLYDEAYQEPDEHKRKQISQHACRTETYSKQLAMVALAQTEEKIPLRMSDFDTHRMLLNCQNGTLDLSRGVLRPHQREDYLTKIIPVAYDLQATCPMWMAFLDKVFAGDKDLISFVQRAIGSALTGEMHDQCFFVMYGQGANGKSTFIEAIRAILTDYALETPPETLMVKRNEGISNDIARLQGARFVSSRESDEGERLSEGKVKQITGGDAMTARYLHQEFFEFHPQFKLFLATNHRPAIRGTDNGIWRRVRLIPFEVSIPENERDTQLLKKLLEELPGILTWAVKGCMQWQAHGLGQAEVVKAATASYRAEMDTLGSFLEDRCYLGEKARERASVLYAAYIKWCQDNGERIETQQCFGSRLTERGLTSEKRGGVCSRKGIGLRDPSEQAE